MTRQSKRAVAERQGQVFYDVLGRSPIGPIYLAAGRRGLLAVGLATDERSFVKRVARLSGEVPVRSAPRLRQAKGQMRDYLSGKRKAFRLALDLSATPSFQRAVLEATQGVRRGSVVTYGELAARLGHPKAGRAVGQALAHNPLPVVIPCHRVVSRAGELRGYMGDRIGLKARLLAVEGVRVQGKRCLARPGGAKDR